MFLDFYISLCKTDCSSQNFTSLIHLISKMDFTVIKYSGQGSFKVKKGTIDKLIFTENHRHLPIASVNDPLKAQLIAVYFNRYMGRKSLFFISKCSEDIVISYMEVNAIF